MMKTTIVHIAAAILLLFSFRASGELSAVSLPASGDFILSDGKSIVPILVETNDEHAVLRAAGDLAEDFKRVTGMKPKVENEFAAAEKFCVIIGTLGKSKVVDRLAAEGKLESNGVSGQWESYVLQVVKNPLPGVDAALVIAGGDRRGTIYGIYQLSELIGVSPWYWWADAPVAQKKFLALQGDNIKQGPPAVKYRGIFLNDEDWGLHPWASKTFEPETGNIGPKTYAKIFELLLRLRANYLWPAMHPGTAAFNSCPTNKFLADEYGVVMGSSHCEQMLRNNISEWDEKALGEYNFVTNPEGVLRYWEERVKENGKFENVYTMGMRGIHDSGMPGGGTEREKAARLQAIIAGQRVMLARNVNTNVAAVPQIFCPYKEVLPLYRLMTNLPDDITLVWPDDNYGYIRQFSDERERQRSGGAGVYYHVSYYGAPQDYLWLCSTPPGLIAEEMVKAFDYGANKVWIVNVGDLKPAELDAEFFLKLAWNPHAWNGANTYALFEKQLARDFGKESAPELTSILAEYYRLNFQRKPEHVGFPTNAFSGEEAGRRLADWRKLAARVELSEKKLSPESRDEFFELVGYPVRAAALANERILTFGQAQSAQDEIHRLTGIYNNQIADGKWRGMMSSDPRKQVEAVKPVSSPLGNSPAAVEQKDFGGTNHVAGADFAEDNHRVVMEAEHASVFLPGKDATWQKIAGLGYNGESVSVFPMTVSVRSTPEKILKESPCLQFKIGIHSPGEWKFTVRALPTFSVETGKPQRYAIALDAAPPQVISLPVSLNERNAVWQENVLRNAALTTSTNIMAQSGLHTLKIWMVDPGIVLDTIEAETGGAADLGYVWPPETRIQK